MKAYVDFPRNKGDNIMKSKYIIPIISITLIVILFSNIIFITNFRKHEEDDFIRLGEKYTYQVAEILNLWIDDQVRLVRLIAQEQIIIDLCEDPTNPEKIEKAEAYLSWIHKEYPYYENLPISLKLENPIIREFNGEEIVIENGTFVVDTVDGKTLGKGGMSYSYVHEILNRKEHYISEIYPSILRGNPIFVVSAPVYSKNELCGVAIVSPQMDYFSEMFIDQLRIGETGYMFMLDESGATVAHINRDLILNNEEDVIEKTMYIIEKIESDSNYFEANLIDLDKLYYGRKIAFEDKNNKNDLYVVYSQNKDETFEIVKESTYAVAVTSAFSIIFLVATYIYVNHMQREKEKEEQLIKMNKELEMQVSERTKELKVMAIMDGLTGLYNRQYIENELKKIIGISNDDENNIYVMLADIDDFKKVNDNYGHIIGDEVLRKLSHVFQQVVGNSGCAGRYGGEEFLIVLTRKNKEEVCCIAEEIRASIEKLRFSKEDLQVTISIGIAKWNGEKPDEITNKADMLLYKAKASGKNKYVI